MKWCPAVLGLSLAALVGFGQAVDAEEADQAPVGWACEMAFEMATQVTDPTAVASDPVADPTRFDDTVRMCISPEEWATAAAAYPDAFGGMDPMEFFASRCADLVAGLAGYTACHLYRSAQGEPVMEEVPWEPELVPLPQPMKANVSGAARVRWFKVRGNSVDDLLAMTVTKAERSCDTTDTLACIDGGWSARTTRSFDRRTGRCTVTGVLTSVRVTAYLPRWAGPPEVDPDVLTWWRALLDRVAWHEARHIEILRERLVELKEQLEGQPCRRGNGIVRRWEKGTEQAQQDFDASEQERGLPLRPEYWSRP